MNSRWQIFPDRDSAASACAQFVTATLLQALQEQPQATFAISGGSSPKPLFHDLADLPIPWDRVHLFWVDERSVPPQDADSNFRLADELLIQPGRLPLANVHRIMGELPPEEAAKRYIEDITKHFQLQPGELPEFTLVHQGIGPDGHTASLFPGDPLINDRTRIAAATWVEKMETHRITLLPGVLLKARHTVFLADGAEKSELIDNILNGDYAPHQYPSQLFAREGRDVHWFLDEAAGASVASKEVT